MKLVLPMPPNKANQRKHWWVANNEKKEYWQACTALAAARGFPRPPKEPYERVRLRVTMYVWAPNDPDNAMARLKPVIDWIVGRGYVVDDRGKNIEWEGLPTQIVDRKNMRLEIEIEPLPDTKAEHKKGRVP